MDHFNQSFRDHFSQSSMDHFNQSFRDHFSQALKKPWVFNRPHHWHPSVDPALECTTEVSQGQSPMDLHGTIMGKSTMELTEKLHQDFDREAAQECSRQLYKDPNMGPNKDLAMIRLQGLLHQQRLSVQVLHQFQGINTR